MKRIVKSRRGFALAEMVLVIAIIVILAAVLAMSVNTYLTNARARSNEVAASRRSVLVNIASSEAEMGNLGFGNSNANIHPHTSASPVAAPTSATT